ncbi:GIY-YIG nuclease family protein [Desulfovibrio sp. JC022]|uniref:GIY-YIG nuclease family protein n=1 Tax=Desulfovibrio sp. JC022 TaxID=2593642 RepID=UPI0013D1AD7E|nr:GIY-YIG nuclease family protein [Desulfovibrio sp. JC022]NDV24707.1 GIY-YIG nuclease family protein [Desulfovibrio sp. JC022]
MGKLGYIYILRQNQMPNMVKIGRTSREPEKRAAEISSVTGVPTPYKVFWAALVEDHEGTEKYLHQQLAQYHLNKEFFEISAEKAESYVTSLLTQKSIHYSVERSEAVLKAQRIKAEQDRMRRTAIAKQKETQRIEEERKEKEQKELKARIQAEREAKAKAIRKKSKEIAKLKMEIKECEKELNSFKIENIIPYLFTAMAIFLFFIKGNGQKNDIIVGTALICVGLLGIYFGVTDKKEKRNYLNSLKMRYTNINNGRIEF